jgi:hypothetical protein
LLTGAAAQGSNGQTAGAAICYTSCAHSPTIWFAAQICNGNDNRLILVSSKEDAEWKLAQQCTPDIPIDFWELITTFLNP